MITEASGAEAYVLAAAGLGALVLLVAWLPMGVKELPLSLPIICVLIGIGLFSLPRTGQEPDPAAYPEVAERLTELVVIVALMGAGLKLDRPLSWRRWTITWRLLGIAMPLTIVAIALLGWQMLGLPLAAAVLFGAALAPTDPVLAADVQVGPPGSGEEDEVRFGLTSEAGLNDGLAFPFIHLAIALTAVAPGWAMDWLLDAVIWKIVAGIGMGWIVGRILGWLTFRMPLRSKLARSGDGLVALGMTLLSYGLTEIVHGYGFLAVFVTAITVRAAESGHDYHQRLHDFSEEIERLLMMVLLVMFGGAIAGGLLAPLGWTDVLVGLVVLFLIRPLVGWISLAGLPRPWEERALIAFFGIRGIGSFYYLAYAFNRAEIADQERLWALIGFIVLVSVVVHGVTVTPLMRLLDKRREAPPPAENLERSDERRIGSEAPAS